LDVAERAVGEHRGVERREEVVPVGNDRAEVAAHKIRMVLDGFGEGAEDDAASASFFWKVVATDTEVDNRVHSTPPRRSCSAREIPSLSNIGPQFRVDFVKTRQRGLGWGLRSS